MGKAARTAVLIYWKSKLSTINTPEDRSVFAKREGQALRFVYKSPDATVSPFNLKRLKISNIAVSRPADKGFSARNSFQSRMQHTSRRRVKRPIDMGFRLVALRSPQ